MTETVKMSTVDDPTNFNPEDTDAVWRSNLPPVFQPIALRVGKHKFSVAWNIGSVQESLAFVANSAKRNQQVMQAIMFASGAVNQLAYYALESQGMTMQELRDIKLDIERAAALDSANRQPASGKLIIPS